MCATSRSKPEIVRRLDEGVRPQRVLHPFDGIGLPVNPSELVGAGHELFAACAPILKKRLPDSLLGLDAGGILPTIALSISSGIPYRIAWKLNLDVPGRLFFNEPHARRREVSIYGLKTGESVLIVDDEVTTGQTIMNLCLALQDRGVDVLGAACFTEDAGHSAREHLAKIDVPLIALYSVG